MRRKGLGAMAEVVAVGAFNHAEDDSTKAARQVQRRNEDSHRRAGRGGLAVTDGTRSDPILVPGPLDPETLSGLHLRQVFAMRCISSSRCVRILFILLVSSLW